MSLADIVAPFFLTAVGAAFVLSAQQLNKEGTRSVLFWATVRKCARLFVLGLLVQGVPFGDRYDLAQLRIPGTLQRIAWCLLVLVIMEICLPRRDGGFEDTSHFRLYRRQAWHWFVCGVFILFYLIFMYATPVPGCSVTGQATPACNAAQYWDSAILGSAHMARAPTYQRLPECSSCSPRYCPIVPTVAPTLPPTLPPTIPPNVSFAYSVSSAAAATDASGSGSDSGAPDEPAAWCSKRFDADGVVGSLAAVLLIYIGAFVGHIYIDTKV